MFWFVLAMCSALLSATAAVLQKKILFRMDAVEFSFAVSFVVALFSFFIPFSTDITSLPLTALLVILGKSFLGASAFLLVMLSLQHNQISSALPLLGLTPALTALLAFIVLGEELKQWEWIGVGLMIAGAFIVERKPSHNSFQSINQSVQTKNYYYIFGAISLFTVSSVADKLLVGNFKTDPLIVLFYQHIVYLLIFGAAVVLRGFSFHKILTKGKEHFIAIVAIAVVTLAYRFTQLEATKLAPIALVLAVKRTSILYASFFGGKLFSEERLWSKLIGALLIVAAGFIILRNVG
jgi:drug/metabolite transporter (DMT)-like permease